MLSRVLVNAILVDRLGIWTYFETNYPYGNIHYVEIPIGRAIDQNALYLPKPRQHLLIKQS